VPGVVVPSVALGRGAGAPRARSFRGRVVRWRWKRRARGLLLLEAAFALLLVELRSTPPQVERAYYFCMSLRRAHQ
jgi:hypothetical protein